MNRTRKALYVTGARPQAGFLSGLPRDLQPYFQALGQRVAKARAAADLTEVQLADALGISQPQIAFYEVGNAKSRFRCYRDWRGCSIRRWNY